MDTPVLLIAFNRYDTLVQVLDRVRLVKPSTLYIAVDGPREGNENDINDVDNVKNIAKLVDWPCGVHTLFSEKNLGCGYGPATAISWAFESCDRLIILEDDCLPCISFFSFCEEMLKKYENDLRIGMVTGWSPLQKTKYFREYSYLFTNLGNSLGWATWKNRWDSFDMEMSDYEQFRSEYDTCDVVCSKIIGFHYNRHFSRRYKNIESEKKHSWDTQWFFARLKNAYLTIVPKYNQIKYIGFETGTHIPASASYLLIPSDELVGQTIHPKFIIANRNYDKAIFWKGQYRRYGIKNILGHIKRKFSYK